MQSTLEYTCRALTSPNVIPSQGIHVTQFSIGFGPAIFQYQGEEVEYSLRLFPLGGYVAFPDDDPEAKERQYPIDDPDLIRNRSIPERALVISAGIIANMIFAWSVLFTQVGAMARLRDKRVVYNLSLCIPVNERNGDVEESDIKLYSHSCAGAGAGTGLGT